MESGYSSWLNLKILIENPTKTYETPIHIKLIKRMILYIDGYHIPNGNMLYISTPSVGKPPTSWPSSAKKLALYMK